MEWLVWEVSGFLECSAKKGAIEDSAAEIRGAGSCVPYSRVGWGLGRTGLSHQIKLLLSETEELLSMSSLSREALQDSWQVSGGKGRTEGLDVVTR